MRLIDADALDFGECRGGVVGGIMFANLNDVANTIKAAPTIDAVQVVRCEECKYFQDNNGGYPHDECRWGHEETPNVDDYCSYGERKEDKP